jgi:phospholipid/cholesterol/gamma-HCH transport system permease protein
MEAPHQISVTRPEQGSLLIRLSGSWKMQRGLPSTETVRRQLAAHPSLERVSFDTSDLSDWDSGLLVFLLSVLEGSRLRGVVPDRSGLPTGVCRLLELASAVPEAEGTRPATSPTPRLERVGLAYLDLLGGAKEIIAFLGTTCLAFAKFCTGAARYRTCDLWWAVQQCGAGAVPIASLIALLVGLIMAFVGAVQLRPFGAQIFVADLVGLAVTREMAPMMTAIVMAGRTGAAFAAQLGTMTVNEEVDALRTLGISPTEFLVLPRMLALTLMMPLLCLYADFMGILGGGIVGIFMLELAPSQYLAQTMNAIHVSDLLQGIIKSAAFGVLVALAGCLRGMQCGRSSEAVGAATTSAVVTAIVWIIVADAMFAVIFNALGL